MTEVCSDCGLAAGWVTHTPGPDYPKWQCYGGHHCAARTVERLRSDLAATKARLEAAERENEALRIVVQRNPETTLFKDGTYSIIAKDRDGLIRESVSPDVGEAAIDLATKLNLIPAKLAGSDGGADA